jgi:murein DD-endopeptidase MepM/ murein hydrolase activator NlpD
LPHRLLNRFNAALERHLPEQRLFLKSDTETRFVRLKPATQAIIIGTFSVVVAWTIIVTAVLFMDKLGSGSAREQAMRAQEVYEARLDALTADRDGRVAELTATRERFGVALEQVSRMQSALLASEERRRELETGIDVIQTTLRNTMTERDTARTELALLRAEDTGISPGLLPASRSADLADTLEVMTAALDRAAEDQAKLAAAEAKARADMDDMLYAQRLKDERTDAIFERLEEAVTVSMTPLDKMFSAAGMDPEDLLDAVKSGYSGVGGPLGPLLPPDPAIAGADDHLDRAEAILEGLDRMNMYRIAAEKAPFALPLNSAFRFTSGFGRRWGRQHEGVDLAGSYGSPILATADGVVVFAGIQSGYGKFVRIKHDFGIETRYGHMSGIRVSVGDRVSRGDRIGDMGNTGNSTGTHLHYEVRVNGDPINPMVYIKAANDVF